MPHININSNNLFYQKQGVGDELVIFSPGLFMTTHLFEKQLAFFENKYACITYDHRGQGKSENNQNAEITLETLYEDTVALIEHLTDKPVHFVGQSMGGYIGMRLAARRPDLVKTMTLMATTSDTDGWAFKIKTHLLIAGLRAHLKRLVATSICHTIFAPGDNNLPFWQQQFLQLDASMISSIKALNKREAFTSHLKEIHVPTLILSGAKDKVFSPKKMHSLLNIPHAQFITLADVGHSLCWEDPLVVNQLLLDFWTQTRTAV